MMDCSDIRRDLPAFLDGELDEREKVEFRLHMAHCSRCMAQVHYYHDQRRMLRRVLPSQPAPQHLRNAIRASLVADKPTPRRWFAFSLATAGAMACACLALLWSTDLTTPTLRAMPTASSPPAQQRTPEVRAIAGTPVTAPIPTSVAQTTPRQGAVAQPVAGSPTVTDPNVVPAVSGADTAAEPMADPVATGSGLAAPQESDLPAVPAPLPFTLCEPISDPAATSGSLHPPQSPSYRPWCIEPPAKRTQRDGAAPTPHEPTAPAQANGESDDDDNQRQ